MDPKAQNSFLSEANIKEHLSYLKTLKNKFSIIEKSYPELKGKIENLFPLTLQEKYYK